MRLYTSRLQGCRWRGTARARGWEGLLLAVRSSHVDAPSDVRAALTRSGTPRAWATKTSVVANSTAPKKRGKREEKRMVVEDDKDGAAMRCDAMRRIAGWSWSSAEGISTAGLGRRRRLFSGQLRIAKHSRKEREQQLGIVAGDRSDTARPAIIRWRILPHVLAREPGMMVVGMEPPARQDQDQERRRTMDTLQMATATGPLLLPLLEGAHPPCPPRPSRRPLQLETHTSKRRPRIRARRQRQDSMPLRLPPLQQQPRDPQHTTEETGRCPGQRWTSPSSA